MISKETKKSILNDWGAQFPQLYPYSQNKIYKILGMCIIGLELIKIPRCDDYRPCFVCYPLWKHDEKACLDEPLILQEILNNRHMQFDIPYLKHNIYFKKAIESTINQTKISFENDVLIDDLFEMINGQFSHTLVKYSPINQAKLYEFKFYAALYVNDKILIKKVLEEIKLASTKWLPNLFEWKYGKKDFWVNCLEEKVTQQIGRASCRERV